MTVTKQARIPLLVNGPRETNWNPAILDGLAARLADLSPVRNADTRLTVGCVQLSLVRGWRFSQPEQLRLHYPVGQYRRRTITYRRAVALETVAATVRRKIVEAAEREAHEAAREAQRAVTAQKTAVRTAVVEAAVAAVNPPNPGWSGNWTGTPEAYRAAGDRYRERKLWALGADYDESTDTATYRLELRHLTEAEVLAVTALLAPRAAGVPELRVALASLGRQLAQPYVVESLTSGGRALAAEAPPEEPDAATT